MRVKVLHWNICYKEKVENILKFVKTINPDILCLQELTVGLSHNNGQDVAKVISKELGFNLNFSQAHKFADDHIQGNGILSKFPIIKNSNFFIAEPRGSKDYSSEGRTCAVSEIQLTKNQKIIVATTHSSYNHQFTENKEKLNEIQRLIEFFEQNNQKLIFTGDLNATPNSKSIKVIEKHLNHCGPDYSEPTWTTKPFSYNGFKEDKLKWRLDYAFASKDVKVISSRILDTTFSDHLPILLEFEI